MDRDLLPPSLALRRLVNGYQVTQAIHVAAKLGLADHLADGPRASDDLARATEIGRQPQRAAILLSRLPARSGWSMAGFRSRRWANWRRMTRPAGG